MSGGYINKTDLDQPVVSDEAIAQTVLDQPVVSDEAIAQALQEEEEEENEITTESETEEGEEEEVKMEDDVLLFLDEESWKKLEKKHGTVSSEFKKKLMDYSNPDDIQKVISELDAIVKTEKVKLALAKSAKGKLVKMYNDQQKEKEDGKKGESKASLKRRSNFNAQVHLNGQVYMVEVAGKTTFKGLRELLRYKYPAVFGSDKSIKEKMVFRVRGFGDTMNKKNRNEMSKGWGITSGTPLDIDITLSSSSASSSTGPSQAASSSTGPSQAASSSTGRPSQTATTPKPKAKRASKSKKDKKDKIENSDVGSEQQ